MEKKLIISKIKSMPRAVWILLVIMIAGIFLRTYNFHDWLRFNADQGRDAEVVSGVVDGSAPLPLLGPKAGGTEFKLGGAFYYFEIASAKLFGDYPDKMAYPDLLTGILCIPLLFFFLRKYFDEDLSLALTAVFAVSGYAIRYARFAWNPNSTPFWTMLALYAMSEVISGKKNRKFLWSAVAGAAIGVGVQLHTTLLLFLPMTAIIVFGYLTLKNVGILKYFFVILAVALSLNALQIVHEYRTNGDNIKAFFGGVKTKQQAEGSFLDNVFHGSSCWIQSNTDIISGYEISDKCTFVAGKDVGDTLVFVLGAFFVIGGMLIGFKYARQEKDADKKLFLLLLAVFTGISFLVFLKLAFELSVRFYLILIFLPFILLGFWIRFIGGKFQMKYFLAAIVFLIASNLFFVQKYFSDFAGYTDRNGGNFNVVILSQVETFSRFIVANSEGEGAVYVDGDQKFLFKAIKPIRYMAKKSNIDILDMNKKKYVSNSYFYIGSLKDKTKMLNDANIEIIKSEDYGGFSIMLINKITDK